MWRVPFSDAGSLKDRLLSIPCGALPYRRCIGLAQRAACWLWHVGMANSAARRGIHTKSRPFRAVGWPHAFWGSVLLAVCFVATSAGWAEEAGPISYLEGHSEPVYAVAYSPDGKWVVSGSFDRRVKVWRRDTRHAERTFADHQQIVLSVAVSPDGSRLASGGLDKQIFLNAMPTASHAAELTGLSKGAGALAVSADGQQLAVIDGAQRLLIYAAGEAQPKTAFDVDAADMQRLAFNADGSRLVGIDAQGGVKVWATETGKLTGTLPSARAVAAWLLPGNKLLGTVGTDGTVRILDWPAPLPRELSASMQAVSTTAAPDGSWFVQCDEQGVVHLRRTSDGAEMRSIAAGKPLVSMAVSTDGARLAGCGKDAVLRVWNVADGKPVASWSIGKEPARRIVWRPGRAELAVATPAEGGKAISLWRVTSGAARETALGTAPLRVMAASTDRQRLALGDWQATLHIVSASDGKVLRTVSAGSGPIQAVALDATASRVAVAGEEPRIRIVSIDTGGVLSVEGVDRPQRALAFSPDGSLLAGGAVDGKARIWRLADGAVVRHWEAHQGPVVAVRFAREGNWLITAGGRAVQFWNMEDGASLRTIDVGQTIASLAMFPDGNRLAVGTTGGRLRVYATGDGKMQLDIAAHRGEVRSVDVAPEASRLLSTGPDGRIRVWDASTGARLEDVNASGSLAGMFDFRGNVVAAGDDGRLRVRPLRLVARLAEHGEPVADWIFDADGKRLLTASEDRTVRVWDVETRKLLATTPPVDAPLKVIATSADASLLAAGGDDGRIHVWQTAKPEKPQTIDTGQPVRALTFSAGSRLAVAGADGMVRVFELPSGRLVQQHASTGASGAIRHLQYRPGDKELLGLSDSAAWLWSDTLKRSFATRQAAPLAVGQTADAKQLIIVHNDGVLSRWNPTDGKPQGEIRLVEGEVRRALVSSDGKFALALNNNGRLAVADVGQGKPVGVFGVSAEATGMALARDASLVHLIDRQWLVSYRVADGQELSRHPLAGNGAPLVATWPDGSVVVARVGQKTLARWNAPSTGPQAKLEGHGSHVYAVAWSPDGKRLASASADKTLRLWNAADGKAVATGQGHGGPVYSVAYHPQGAQLATCSSDKTIRIWNPDDAKAVRTINAGIGDGLYSIAYSPDGGQLLAAGLDKAWHVFNITEDKPLRSVTGHSDTIYRAIYNPAGSRVATLGYSGSLFIWDAATGKMLHQDKLPVRAAYAMAYAPDGAELAIGTTDPRVILYRVPDQAR